MREYRQQDSLGFRPFLFYHVYLNVIVELCRLLKLDGYSYVLGFPIENATAFEVQVSNDVVTFISLTLSKVVVDGIFTKFGRILTISAFF